jgi:hypothetical protein
MKKYQLIIFTCFLGFNLLSQNTLKTRIINATNNEPIAYAAVGLLKENIGISSDDNGDFELTYSNVEDTLIVSCVGFSTLYIKVSNVKNEIKLTPKIIELQTVTIKPRKQKKLILNDFKGRKVEFYYSSSDKYKGSAQYAQRFLPPKEGDWFLKEISLRRIFNIIFDNEPCTYRIHFYGVDSLGKPNDTYLCESILVNSKSKKDKIDMLNKKLVMPKNGLFISFEWIRIKENLYCHNTDIIDNKGKKIDNQIRCHYAPTIATFKGDSTRMQTYFSRYSNGKWNDGNRQIKSSEFNAFRTLGIALTIMD